MELNMAKIEIRSQLPGVFYRKPSPDEPTFKEVGDTVKAGDAIGLVEVMKTFQQINADAAGIIVSFEVEDSDVISPGQVLAVIEG
jgi:biotin carboxyl carrier protein|tara:strand:- start:127 stop:381 length:255 start_codon:yes stop_codon:yes gene_type:complete